MKDTKISNFKLNERDEISFKVTIKDTDYTIWEREIIKEACKNWDTLDLEIIGLVKWDEENQKKSKLQQLALNMQTYCDKTNESIEWHTKIIYKKYNVTTRKDMLLEDIVREIDSYKMWIFEYSA